MASRARRASWLLSGLVLVILMLFGLELVVAQPQDGDPGLAYDADGVEFTSLGDRLAVNTDNIAYTSDEGGVFDIYFACSSARGADPLRLSRPDDKEFARACFNGKNQFRYSFKKFGGYCVNMKHVAYVEFVGDSVVLNFSARVMDDFVQLKLSGADADEFKKRMLKF